MRSRRPEVVPAHRVSSKIPLGLSVIAGRAMERDPDQRYPSARHLSMELRHWVDSAEARALRNESRGTPNPFATPHGKAARPHRGCRWPSIALVAGGLLVDEARHLAVHRRRRRRAGRERAGAGAPARVCGGRTRFGRQHRPSAIAAVRGRRRGIGRGRPLPPHRRPRRAPRVRRWRCRHAAPAPAPDRRSHSTASPRRSMPDAAASKARRAQHRPSSARPRPRAAARRWRVATVTEGVPISAVLAEGVVQLAVSPWGQVEVDGKPMGTSPPLTRLTLVVRQSHHHGAQHRLPGLHDDGDRRRRESGPRCATASVPELPLPTNAVIKLVLRSALVRLIQGVRRPRRRRHARRVRDRRRQQAESDGPDRPHRASGGASADGRDARLRRRRLSRRRTPGQRSDEAGACAATRDVATAHKLRAFVYCTSNRLAACEAEFPRCARRPIPAFVLSHAEAGHPVWGPVYLKSRQ